MKKSSAKEEEDAMGWSLPSYQAVFGFLDFSALILSGKDVKIRQAYVGLSTMPSISECCSAMNMNDMSTKLKMS